MIIFLHEPHFHHPTRGGGDRDTMVGTKPDNPDDASFAIGDNHDLVLRRQRNLLVGKQVAHLLVPSVHAIRAEHVAHLPRTQEERKAYLVSIGEQNGVRKDLRGTTITLLNTQTIRNAGTRTRLHLNLSPIDQSRVVSTCEQRPRAVSRQCSTHLTYLSAVETIGGIGVEECAVITQVLNRAQEQRARLRLNLLHEREKPQAHLIAFAVRLEVGAVGHEIPSVRRHGTQNLIATHTEQRSNHTAPNGFHATQPLQSRATKHVEKNRFDVVVGMMSHGYGFRPRRLSHALEPLVALLTRRHLDGDTMGRGVRARVEMLDQQGDLEHGTEVTHEAFVTVALLRPQMEVAMRHHAVIAQSDETAQ